MSANSKSRAEGGETQRVKAPSVSRNNPAKSSSFTSIAKQQQQQVKPIMNQVVSKMLEKNVLIEQMVAQNIGEVNVDKRKRNGRVNSFIWTNTMSTNNLH